jgi:dihydrofolate reductase
MKGKILSMSPMKQHKSRELIVSAWMTLDGVFDADTMDQWFLPYDSKERQEYITEGILAADTLLLGRTTYEMLAPHWSALKNNEEGLADKLNSVRKYVVSSTLKRVDWNNSTIIKENVVEEVTKLKKKPGTEIQIEGSATLVQTLMEANLVDEYRFLVHPIVMGSGKHFFNDRMHTSGLKLTKTQTLDLGVILLCYQPSKS